MRTAACAVLALAILSALVPEPVRGATPVAGSGDFSGRVELDSGRHGGPARETAFANVVAIHESLERLEKQDGRTYQVVLYRYFCDLTVEETAELMGISERTVKREWKLARAWLQADLAPKTTLDLDGESNQSAP